MYTDKGGGLCRGGGGGEGGRSDHSNRDIERKEFL